MLEAAFQVAQAGTAQVVSLSLPEAMDSRDFDRLNEELLNLFASQPHAHWVLDLSGLDYMGSAALGLLVNIRQRIRQSGGLLVLCGLSPRLLRIFQTCCMERLFVIARTQAEAIREIQRR